MEFSVASFQVFISFLVFVFLVLKIGKRSKSKRSSPNLPPGPWKLPIIGNLHQLVGSPPHRRLRDLAMRHGPLMHLQFGEVSTIVVSSPEFAEEVMKTHDTNFAYRPYNVASDILTYNSRDISFAPYGEYWRQLRKICILEVTSMKRVQSFRGIREEEISHLIKWIHSNAGSPINITHTIHSLSNKITAKAAFGTKCKDEDTFLSLVDESSKLVSGFNLSDLFPSIGGLLRWFSGQKSQLEKTHQEVDRILENIISEHNKSKETPGIGKNEQNEDLINVLLRIQQGGDSKFSLSTKSIKALIFDIFGAGSETSATTFDWAMSEMMKNPRVMKKAQAEVREVMERNGKVDETAINEMTYLKLVIKEVLRYHPPAPLLIPRECKERCEIKGFEVPSKTRVFINAWSMGRDPKYWSDADKFIPERFLDSSIDFKGNNFEYVPFGAGRRICPGMQFGLANIEIPLAMLLYHFDWKLPDQMKPEDLDMIESFGISVRRKQDLYVIPTPYHPPSAFSA